MKDTANKMSDAAHQLLLLSFLVLFFFFFFFFFILKMETFELRGRKRGKKGAFISFQSFQTKYKYIA